MSICSPHKARFHGGCHLYEKYLSRYDKHWTISAFYMQITPRQKSFFNSFIKLIQTFKKCSITSCVLHENFENFALQSDRNLPQSVLEGSISFFVPSLTIICCPCIIYITVHDSTFISLFPFFYSHWLTARPGTNSAVKCQKSSYV